MLTPEPGDPGGRFRLSAGSFDRYSATLEGGNGTARGGLHVLDDGGYREDSGALQVKGFGKVKLGETTLRIAGQHLEQETAGYILGDEAYADDALRRSNPNPEAFRDLDHLLLSAEIPFAAAGWEGTITPFARYTQMDFLLHFFPGDPLEENEHGSIGFQSTASRSLSAEVELLAGLDLDLTRGSLREFQENETVFSFTQGLHYDYTVDAVEAAPFARLSWQAADNLTLQAGGRVTVTRYDYETDAEAGVFGRYFRPEDRTDEFGVVTGKLAALYELGPNGTVYASLARGARPPQTSELYRLQSAQTPDGIDPERMDAIELGWRKASERGRIAVTGFAMRKENVFFRDADGFNVTDGETTHVGIEAEGLLRLTDTLSLSGAGTWAAHEYGFDRIVSDASEIIRDGDRVDTAPKTLGSAQLRWTPVPELTLEAAYTHVASYYTNAANTQDYEGHDLLDLRASWSPAERLTILGIVRNVTDERYARRADYAFGNARYFPGEERAYEVNLTVAF
ncbi:TonB-dependent receptor [Parvularcula oceani]|uniref:TonB-dependent receptor n=1 Tax=Parvularcula oceani TaxID=1247963 RepID=UPI00068D40C8|nr:TonB-dependent receptor [Parvularcula oceani]